MDERFPKWLRVFVRKLDFLAIPNIGMLVCGLAILAFIARAILSTPFEHFVFDPQRVLQGEWWRLFAFPLSEGLSDPIWLIFYVLYVFYVMSALEGAWGAGPLTVFVLLGYVCALVGAFVTGQPVPIWYYILENVSLAFGTLFPEVELYIYFILPVKAKWLAVLAGGIVLFQFLTGGPTTKLVLAISLLPYFLFFSPMLYGYAKRRWMVAKNRRRFDQDMWR